ncbi:hypothetical protein K474DRAFT_1706673 [Panus rudis PR-1116 ss-1]|nr:hypothetical protein K474DRAFT_1706673 [Panus rudis PR-1116 ss-1]
MFVAVDANFRLKRCAISNESRDPALSSGLGYFVEDKKYREHLAVNVSEPNIPQCSEFSALKQADTKHSKGYATTGICVAMDARHGFVLPNSAGDLQKGERYCNVDYVFASALSLLPQEIQGIYSYDIMCAYIKHLFERITQLPAHLQVDLPVKHLRYAIPKYHFNGHHQQDHSQYSLNLIPGAATREMGPGSRHDMLEDHFGFANWKKYVGIGDALEKRLHEARIQQHEQVDTFTRLKSARGLRAENVELWTKEVIAWERNPSRPDPYHIPPSGLTQSDIQLQLAEEDNERDEPNLHEISPSNFLANLLRIEDEQRKFRLRHYSPAGGPPTATVEVVEKRSAMSRKIKTASASRSAVPPSAASSAVSVSTNSADASSSTTTAATSSTAPLSNITSTSTRPSKAGRRNGVSQVLDVSDLAENLPLFMPSSLSPEQRATCEQGLVETEARLREGQLRDALDKLRIQLHVKSGLIGDRIRNVRHQAQATRAQHRMSANERKIITYAEKYRVAHRAKLALSGHGDWEKEWQVLEKRDVCTLQQDPFDIETTQLAGMELDESGRGGVSEGRKQISWIWMSADQEGNGQKAAHITGASEALCVAFLKARARARRWTEEVLLVQEEQRRVVVSLEKTALAWEEKQGFALTVESPAEQQAIWTAEKKRYGKGKKKKIQPPPLLEGDFRSFLTQEAEYYDEKLWK